jgi:hypothetical protein
MLQVKWLNCEDKKDAAMSRGSFNNTDMKTVCTSQCQVGDDTGCNIAGVAVVSCRDEDVDDVVWWWWISRINESCLGSSHHHQLHFLKILSTAKQKI